MELIAGIGYVDNDCVNKLTGPFLSQLHPKDALDVLMKRAPRLTDIKNALCDVATNQGVSIDSTGLWQEFSKYYVLSKDDFVNINNSMLTPVWRTKAQDN